MKYTILLVLVCLTAHATLADNDLSVLTDEPGKQLEWLLQTGASTQPTP